MSGGKVDPRKRPFYDCFWIAACSLALLEFYKVSSNVVFEKLVLGSLIASPLVKPFLTPGANPQCSTPGGVTPLCDLNGGVRPDREYGFQDVLS